MWRSSNAALLAALALGACGSSHLTATSSTSSAPSSPSSPSSSSSSAPSSPSPSSSSSSSASRATGRCAALTTAYVGTQGATGHLEVTFSLRNVSKQRCAIQGYPSTTLLGPSGKALPMRLKRGHGFFPDTMRPARTVVLAPGARARFGVSFVTNREFAGAHTCRTAVSALAAMSSRTMHPQPVSLRRAPKISPCGDQLVISPVYA